jgi:hypothetical protein
MKIKHSFSVLIVLVTANILSAQSFLVKDAVDGHPLLINGGLGGGIATDWNLQYSLSVEMFPTYILPQV